MKTHMVMMMATMMMAWMVHGPFVTSDFHVRLLTSTCDLNNHIRLPLATSPSTSDFSLRLSLQLPPRFATCRRVLSSATRPATSDSHLQSIWNLRHHLLLPTSNCDLLSAFRLACATFFCSLPLPFATSDLCLRPSLATSDLPLRCFFLQLTTSACDFRHVFATSIRKFDLRLSRATLSLSLRLSETRSSTQVPNRKRKAQTKVGDTSAPGRLIFSM